MAKKRRKPMQKKTGRRLTMKDGLAEFQRHYSVKNYPACMRVLQELIDSRQGVAQVLINASIVSVHMEKWQEAVDFGEKALKAAPDRINLLDALSQASWGLKNKEAAAKYGLRALELRDASVPETPPVDLALAPVPPGADKKIIAFSLFGGSSKYCETAVLNCEEQPRLYPGWLCRFYVDDSVPDVVLERIKGAGGEVIQVPETMKAWPGPMWRFAAYDAPDAKTVIFRDADSVIFEREVGAVDEWLQEGEDFHLLRDNGSHTELVLAGLWGAHKGALPPMSEMVADFLRTPVKDAHFADQYFLRAYVWPHARDNMTHHDAVFGFKGGKPFPEGPSREDNHVGFAEGSPVINASTDLPDGADVTWAVQDKADGRELCRYPGKVTGVTVVANVPVRYAKKIVAGTYRVVVEPT